MQVLQMHPQLIPITTAAWVASYILEKSSLFKETIRTARI